MNNTFQMNQYAGDLITPQTPLHNVQSSVEPQGLNPGVTLNERAVTGQLVIRLRGDLVAASNVMQSVCGVELPMRLTYVGAPHNETLNTIAWMSPDEWRLCCPLNRAFELEQQLLSELSSVPGLSLSVVNNSGGFTIIDLSGPDAENLLKKSTSYDIRARNFPVGKVVNTTFAKGSATLLKTGEDQWQLWVRRSFADYIWLWLQHSARDYGMNTF